MRREIIFPEVPGFRFAQIVVLLLLLPVMSYVLRAS